MFPFPLCLISIPQKPPSIKHPRCPFCFFAVADPNPTYTSYISIHPPTAQMLCVVKATLKSELRRFTLCSFDLENLLGEASKLSFELMHSKVEKPFSFIVALS